MWCVEWYINIGNVNIIFFWVLYFCINYRGCMLVLFFIFLYFIIVCLFVCYLFNVFRKKWVYLEISYLVFFCLLFFDKYLYVVFDIVWGVYICRIFKFGLLIYLWGWSFWCCERIIFVSVWVFFVFVLCKLKWYFFFRS